MGQLQDIFRGNDTLLSARFKSTLALGLTAVLAACGGSQVKLSDPTIPEPLIEKMPISVVARFPENFEHFVHEERVIGKEKWTIDLGRANAILFTQLFGSMFTDFAVIEGDTDPRDLGVDAYIEPAIDAFEFSVPSQSQSEDFAVWIRYRIKIFDGHGDQVASWPIAAYGKSQTTTFGSDAALRRAAVLAMRDAAALVIMQMDKETGISKLGPAANAAVESPDQSAVQEPNELLQDAENLQITASENPR